jgi:hypothetical protein
VLKTATAGGRETKSIESDVERRLAELCSFDPDWPEWTRDTAAAFQQRLLRALGILPPPVAAEPSSPARQDLTSVHLTPEDLILLGKPRPANLPTRLGSLVRKLRHAPDDSFDRQLAETRVMRLDAAIESLSRRNEPVARRLSDTLHGERRLAADGLDPREVSEFHHLHRRTIIAKRRVLLRLRESGAIEEDAFHRPYRRSLSWPCSAARPELTESVRPAITSCSGRWAAVSHGSGVAR